ncbi:Vacuolar cation/proton exchanger 3 [Asimina triloba]
MASSYDYNHPWTNVENGNIKGASKEVKRGRTAHNMSSSSLRKKSDLTLLSKVPSSLLRRVLANLQEVLLGTKLSILFPAIPLAIVAWVYNFGRSEVLISCFAAAALDLRFELVGAHPACGALGGLLNATCGNATELIIAMLALNRGKIEVVKCSLLGSVLSNLLLVLGTSLLCGGLANLRQDQKYDRKQADVNTGLLIISLLCHMLPLMFKQAANNTPTVVEATLQLSRASSIIMLIAYVAYLFFQLKTHRQLFEAQEVSSLSSLHTMIYACMMIREDFESSNLHDMHVCDQGDEVDDDAVSDEEPVIGFTSAFVWLAGMTIVIAVLSEFVVGTIEAASQSWGISVKFISIILLPIVGNAAEHAGAIIFAFKNKLDISLGVALGSATQVAMFVVPLSVIVAWIMGIQMDLDFNLLETGSLFIAVVVTAFTLQDGTSHYLKGLVLLLCYIIIGACFFVLHTPPLRKYLKHNLTYQSAVESDQISSSSWMVPYGPLKSLVVAILSFQIPMTHLA